MPLSVFDRVREITSTTGSGSITLGGAVSGFQSFNSVFDDGDQTYYAITNSNNWEIGLGTYTSGSFSRDQIFDSNNNGLPLSLSGTSYIFVTYPASKSVHKNLADEIPVGSAGLRFSDNTLQTTAATAATSGNNGGSGTVTYVGLNVSISGINVDTGQVIDSGTLSISGTVSEVTEGAVTQHESALSITTSQIADFDYELNKRHNGLITPGNILSVNGTDNSKFDVSAGSGVINNEYVFWPASTGNAVTNMALYDRSYIYISSSGTIYQSIASVSPEYRRSHLFLGQLGHTNNTTIGAAVNSPDVWKNPDDQFRDFVRAIGVQNVDGNFVSANGTNLNINISEGRLYGIGANWENSEDNPNLKTFSSLSAPTFRHRTQTGEGNSSSILDVSYWDDGGTRSYITSTKAQNFRVYRLVSGNIVIQYGQALYNNLSNAITNINSETFIKYGNLSEIGSLIGVISVMSNASDLSDETQAKFYNITSLSTSTSIDLDGYIREGSDISLLSNDAGYISSLNKSYLNITSNTVASVSYDAYFVDSSSGSVQLTLPLASGNGGKQFVIKRIAGSNPVIVAGSGSDQIDGQSSYNIDFIYQSTTIISNNSSWYKI